MCRMSTLFRSAGLILALPLLITGYGFGAWPSDNTTNLAVCSAADEQTVPKVQPTSDGGCYVAWMTRYDANYCLAMQRYDGDGNPQWGENGILVSEHPQNGWITDYGFFVDWDDNAYLALNDVRSATAEPVEEDWEIYLYKITPEGEFPWGADGIRLTDNQQADLAAKIIQTSEGNLIVLWQRMELGEDPGYSVILSKFDENGDPMWDPAERVISDDTSVAWPSIMEWGDDECVVQYETGDPGEVTLHLQRFSASGNPMWGADGIAVTEPVDLPFFASPLLTQDNFGGVISVWYQGVGFAVSRVFAQRVTGDGAFPWGTEPLQLTTSEDVSENGPVVAPIMMMGGGGAMVFFKSQKSGFGYGVVAQYVSYTGERGLGDEGLLVQPYTYDYDPTWIATCPAGWGQVYLVTARTSSQDMSDCLLIANKYTMGGDETWSSGPAVLSRAPGEKGRIQLAEAGYGLLTVWQDGRNGFWDNPDIYLHSINEFGSDGGAPYLLWRDVVHGPFLHQLPWHLDCFMGNFSMPDEGALRVTIECEGEPFDEFDVTSHAVQIDALGEGENQITLHLVDSNGDELDPPLELSTWAIYHSQVVLSILSPDPGATVTDLPVRLSLQVESFELGVDGMLFVLVSYNGTPSLMESTVATEIDISDLSVGYNDIHVRLTRMDGTDLTPPLFVEQQILYDPTSAPETDELPFVFALHTACPNPFNAQTTLQFDLPGRERVRLAVYDLLGREVMRLVDRQLEAGRHQVSFNASSLASGVYFCRIEAGVCHATTKLALIK